MQATLAPKRAQHLFFASSQSLEKLASSKAAARDLPANPRAAVRAARCSRKGTPWPGEARVFGLSQLETRTVECRCNNPYYAEHG